MATVDVVVPSYQYGRYLRGCVESVLTQEGVDLRVLIIDNASTDDSVEVARALAVADGRVEVVARPRNLGPQASFNEGIDWARADFFLILCADDLLAPGALARAASVMERNPGVHLTFGAVESAGAGDPAGSSRTALLAADWRIVPGKALLERFCRTGRNHVPGPTAIVRTSVQKRVGHYRSEVPQTDDMEVWMRFALLGDAAQTDAVQGIARVHPLSQSASSRTVHDWDREFLAAFELFFARDGAALPDARRLLRRARRSLSERAYWCALSHLCRRQPAVSMNLLRFALTTCPDMAVLPPLAYLLRRPDSLDRIRRAAADLIDPLMRRNGGAPAA